MGLDLGAESPRINKKARDVVKMDGRVFKCSS